MLLTAKEIATRYAGCIVKCKVTTSSPVIDSAGIKLDYFDAKIIGWKLQITPYVLLEILAPGITINKLLFFNSGYYYTAPRNTNAYGKKVLPEEIILPTDSDKVTTTIRTPAKVIPEWPDKCRDCGSPAFILSTRIDCSNTACKHKFKTHSATDLFLPKEQRPPGWDKDPNRKRRYGVDNDDFVICISCKKRAFDGTFTKDKIGELKATCPDGHKWTSDLHIGDKVAGKDRVLIYKGKNVFIPYKV
jgi:hypothetical protein